MFFYLNTKGRITTPHLILQYCWLNYCFIQNTESREYFSHFCVHGNNKLHYANITRVPIKINNVMCDGNRK